MKFFWPIYLLTATVATAVVYVAGPLARPYLQPIFASTAEVSNGDLDSQQPAAILAITKSQQTPAPVRSSTTTPATAPDNRSSAFSDDDDDMPPALKKIFIANARDTPEWGITRQEANFYQLDGTRLGKIGGGMIFACDQIRNSSRGAMVECRFKQSSGNEKTVLLSRKEVHLFTGKFEDLSKKQQDALQQYYTLTGKITARKAEVLEAASQKNPHFKSYQAAYKRYLDHVEKAKGLVAQRDAATGLTRANLEDQLRNTKAEESRIKAELDATDTKYREWKAQHPESQVNPADDPQIKRWNSELPALRKVIPGLAA